MLAEFIDPAILGFVLIGVMLFSIFVGFPNIFYSNFFRFCFWIFRFWKVGILFDDLTVFDGNDRANPRRRSSLCIYGYNDGASWVNGKIIFSFSINVS